MINTVRNGQGPRFQSPGGNTTTPLASPDLGAKELLVLHQEQLPGGTNPLHSKSREAFVVVLAGTIDLVTATETVPLGEGDAALITADTEHRLTNTGDAAAQWIVATPADVEFTMPAGGSIQPAWVKANGDDMLSSTFAELERAWNSGDGADFGEQFAEDADFVDIRGTRHHGKGAIADGHQGILDTIYRGSTVHYRVVDQTVLAPGWLLGIVEATLDAPEGPLAGNNRSTITAVMTRTDAGWKVRSFHNTLVAT